MSEGSQKMEGLILELNKSGLAYLVNSTSSTSKINSPRPSSISKRQNGQSQSN